MKTLSTPEKAQRICSKTIITASGKKYLTVLFCCLLISLQSMSMIVQIQKTDDACAESIGWINAEVVSGGGTLPYVFVWSNGITDIAAGNSSRINNLPAGTYSVTVHDAAGDSSVNNNIIINNASNLDRNGFFNAFNIMTNRDPVASAYSGFACPGQSDGIMFGLLPDVGGAPPFSVSNVTINGSINGFGYTGLGMGGYYFAVDGLRTGDVFDITIADNVGCPGHFTDSELGPDYFSTHVITTSPSTNGQSNGSMNFNSSFGGWPPGMSLNVSNGLGFSYTAPNAFGTFTISSALQPGTYQVVMHYNGVRNNCDTVYNVTVANVAAPQTYFWVGGNGDWNDINHWSNTSGGAASFATPPTTIDDVIFDSNSPSLGQLNVFLPDAFTAQCGNFVINGTQLNFAEHSIGGSKQLEIYADALLQDMHWSIQSNGSTITFKTDSTARIFSPTDSVNARFVFNSIDGTGVFDLYNPMSVTEVSLLSGRLNVGGINNYLKVENFSTDYTAFPRILGINNTNIYVEDIAGIGSSNYYSWLCDTQLVIVANNNTLFHSSSPLANFKMRNAQIGTLDFHNSASIDLSNIHLWSLHNTQTGSSNLNLRGSGYLFIDTLISSATSLNDAVISGFDSVSIFRLTNNSLPPLQLGEASYWHIGNLTSTNKVILYAGDNVDYSINSLTASSIWINQTGTTQNPNEIVINNLDCSLSQGINNYNSSFFEKSCTIGTFTIPAGDQVYPDTAITLNIDTLIATGTVANTILIQGSATGTQTNIHLNKTFCGDYLNLRGLNNTGVPFYAGANSVDAGNNLNIQFSSCGVSTSDYYWVGGTGNWNDVSHWATTSGGTTFNTVPPDSLDDVYFDVNSFPTANDSVISTADVRCHTFNESGVTSSPVFYLPSSRPYIYGSLLLNGNMNITTASIYFVSNNTGNSINTNGYLFHPHIFQNFYMIFDNPNGGWILNSDLNTTYNGAFYSTVRLKQGTLNTNGYAVRCYDFDIFPNPACSLYLDTSSIYCDNSFYALVSAASFILDASQSKIYAGIVNLNAGFSAAHQSFNYVEAASFYGSDCHFNHVVSSGVLIDSSTIGLLELAKPLTAPVTWSSHLSTTAATSHLQKVVINHCLLTWIVGDKILVDSLILNNPGDTIAILGNDTIEVTSGFVANATAVSPITIRSYTPGVTCNFNFRANDVCVDYLNIKENNALGTGNHYAGANSVNSGLNSGWTFGACGVVAPAYYWIGGTGNWNDLSHWATTSGGTTLHTILPTATDDVYFDANSFLSGIDTVYTPTTGTIYCKNFDWTGSFQAPTFYQQTTLNINGSMTLSAGMNYVGYITYFTSGVAGNTINTNGVIMQPNASTTQNMFFLFNNAAGEWTLNSDFVMQDAGTLVTVFYIRGGTVNTNGYSVNCYDFNIWPLSSCALNLGSSTINIEDQFYQQASPNTFTMNPGTSKIVIGSANSIGFMNAESTSFNQVESSSIYAANCNFNHIISSFCYLDNSNATLVEIKHLPYGNPLTPLSIKNYGAGTDTITKCIINSFPRTEVAGALVFDTLFLNNAGDTVIMQGNNTIAVSKFIVNAQTTAPIYLQSDTVTVTSNIDFGANDICVDNLNISYINALGTGIHNAGANSIDAGGNSGWLFTSCSVISDVWPGDANYDLTVNNFDILNIGLAYNETGPVRVGATNNYVAQPANDWSGLFQTGVNRKHADCNGDGIVDDNDTVAIAMNYGQNHPARLVNNTTQSATAPLLYLQIMPDSASLSDTINVDVYLGTSAIPVDSIYGLAFTLSFDTAYIDTIYMPFNYTGSWMGTPGVDLLTFQKTRFLNGAVDMAMVRTDHQNIGGFGFLERIGIVVVDNIGARLLTPITFSNVRAITAAEYELTFNIYNSTISLDTTSSVGVQEIENLQNMISVYPNPAKDKLTIHSGTIKINSVEIYNSMGEMVVNQKINSNVFTANTTNLQQGVYLIRCITEKGILNKRIVVAGKQ